MNATSKRPTLPLALLALGLLALPLLGGCNRTAPQAARPSGPRPTAVRAEPVRRGPLTIVSEHPGELFAEAVDVAPRVQGTLLSLHVGLGDRVKKGALLARLDDAQLVHQLAEARSTLALSEANTRRAQANLELGRTELARKAPLAKEQLVSAQEISEIEARIASLQAEVAAAEASAAQARARIGLLEEQRRELRLVAPFDAVVAERKLDPGATVGPGTPILRLVASGPPRVRFRVPEQSLAVVREDLPLRVRTAATGAQSFEGKVERVGGEVSRTDRLVQVEGVLNDEVPALKPGMYARVELSERTFEDVLLVPTTALLQRFSGYVEQSGVFVADGDRARWRAVEVLGQKGGLAAVEGELDVGAAVLTLGHEDLAPDSLIRVATEANEESAGKAEATK